MPPCSIRDYLTYGVEPFLPSSLLPQGSLRGVPPWIAGIPDATHVVLEFRLADGQDAVDLSWGYEPQLLCWPAGAERGPWRAVDDFSRAWAGGEPMLASVGAICFEADDCHELVSAAPAVFFMISEPDRARYLRVVRHLSSVLSVPLPPAVEATLTACVRNAPPGVVPHYVGFMISRPRMPIRMGLQMAPDRASILSYLASVQWRGAVAPVSTFLDCMSARFPDMVPYVAFDVLDGVQPRLGLEYMLGEPRPGSETRAAAVLDWLVDFGLCSPAKRDALLSWPGCALERRAGTTSSLVHDFVLSGAVDCFRRCVAHVKIVFDEHGTSAKAYVDCSHSLIRPVARAA